MPEDRAIIYEGLGADPHTDRIILQGPNGRVTIVTISDTAQAPTLARALADEGSRLIELCGGISPTWRPKVAAAAGPGVRVSSVTFGIESLQPAAVYSAAFKEDRPPREAFLILMSGTALLRNSASGVSCPFPR